MFYPVDSFQNIRANLFKKLLHRCRSLIGVEIFEFIRSLEVSKNNVQRLHYIQTHTKFGENYLLIKINHIFTNHERRV